jgi:hypothetical protein
MLIPKKFKSLKIFFYLVVLNCPLNAQIYINAEAGGSFAGSGDATGSKTSIGLGYNFTKRLGLSSNVSLSRLAANRRGKLTEISPGSKFFQSFYSGGGKIGVFNISSDKVRRDIDYLNSGLKHSFGPILISSYIEMNICGTYNIIESPQNELQVQCGFSLAMKEATSQFGTIGGDFTNPDKPFLPSERFYVLYNSSANTNLLGINFALIKSFKIYNTLDIFLKAGITNYLPADIISDVGIGFRYNFI